MSDLEFSSEMTVKLVRSMASDDMVVQAAQVSSKGENNPSTVPSRLIEALLRGRHGSPFEHTAFTFFVEVPIFVVREWQRHRISSFNEMSGRYTVLPGKFYIPDENRKMVNVGTKMKPEFDSNPVINNANKVNMQANSIESWERYRYALSKGISNEVARMLLPLNIYTQMYWTVNARSLMNFLSLRVGEDSAETISGKSPMFPSYPQREIEMAAEMVEDIFAREMPATYASFVENGRVAP